MKNKRNFYPFLILFCLIGLLACMACQRSSDSKGSDFDVRQWMQPNEHVKVLSSIAMISDLVQQIGGEHVDALTLIKGELDPHSYQLVKGDDEKLNFADLIFYNGLGLEHGPSLQYHLQNNKKAIALGNKIEQDFPDLILHANGQLDPHIWMDISLWKKTVPYIVEALSLQDPKHQNDYQRNGERLIRTMQSAHEEVKKLLQSIPEKQRYLVTSHDAFNYFTRAYLAEDTEKTENQWQKRFAAPEGLAPESQLSTTDIQHIIDHLAKYHINVLFPESNVSKDSIRKIVSAGKEKGLQLVIAEEALYGDAMGKPGSGGDTYLKMIEFNAHTIAKYLSGQRSL